MKPILITEVHEMFILIYCCYWEQVAHLFVEEGNKGFDRSNIHFNTMHISEYYIQENISGYVDTFFIENINYQQDKLCKNLER